MPYKPKMIYRVMRHQEEMRLFYSLHDALAWIGRTCKGGLFGSMLVTVRQAMDEGFTIEQYREFL